VLVLLLPATRHCSLFAPLLFIFAYEHLMLLSTSDSSYGVGTNLARSLRISDLKNYITGSVLYNVRAVDPTVIMPLNDIDTEQTKSTEKTQATTDQLLNYLATKTDATIHYHASDMILHIHSDASYLSVSNACIRLGRLLFCWDKPPHEETLNGYILNVAAGIKNVVASAA
jgi:hypothetical protein